MKRVIYWDSDVFLRIIEDAENLSADNQGCRDVWAACQKGTTHIITSTLTVAEVLYKKGTPKLDPKFRPILNNFFRDNFISLKPLTREIAEMARDVVWDSNIKPKDAIHVATCAYYRVRELHSFDGNLVDKKTIEVNGFIFNASRPHAEAQSEIVV
jgi:predicted nucleic acid-binding protein